jgi:hypothetical protein
MVQTGPAHQGPGEAAGRPGRPPLRPDMTVRQVAADYPGCREVFRWHGEPGGRPGAFGHLEPLWRFARRHGLDPAELLRELAEAAGGGIDTHAPAGRLGHRAFIAAALLVTLTLGATWGALLLLEIGVKADFASAGSAAVVAHGETQLWGFVALFVIGISLQYLPLATGRQRPGRGLRHLLLATALAGVGGGFVWSLRPGWLGGVLGPASGGALLAAAVAYAVFVGRQVGAHLRHTWARFVLAAALWLLAWGGVTLALRVGAADAGPATYTAGQRLLLIHLALFGFALNAIYGFGRKLLSGFQASATPRAGLVEAAFWLHNGGAVILAVAGLGLPPLVGFCGVALLTVGGFCYVAGMRGFRRARHTPTRPELGPRILDRYVQLAFFWLMAGLALLLAGEAGWRLRGQSPPHAFLGAVRHALTVGFMTTLILGVAQRLLPVLGHTLLAWPQLVRPVFVLIVAGNLLRVITELATPAWPPAFVVMPVSALLELAALTLFAANAVRTLWPAPDPLLRTGQVTTDTGAALLLAEHPWLEDELLGWGCGYVGRVRSVPAELTLGTLLASEGMPTEETIARINALLQHEGVAARGRS